MLKGWTTFEKVWLVVASLVIFGLSLFWKDTTVGFIASISGIWCVILVAKGKISSYLFGTINAIAYGYVAYSYGLFGEAQLNWYFYLPLQIVGFILWYLNSKKTKENGIELKNGQDIVAQQLTPNKWLILVPSIVVAYITYSVYLKNIGSNFAGLDALAVVLSVFAQFLMMFRYAEQWLLWIIINVITVALWVFVLFTHGGNDWTMLAMWIAFLVNSIYGYVNWIKIAKETEDNE